MVGIFLQITLRGGGVVPRPDHNREDPGANPDPYQE